MKSVRASQSKRRVLKLNFELNIRSLALKNVPDDAQLTILWIRGDKNIDTRTRYAKDGKVKFSEKFMMKTSLEFDTELQTYVAKPVSSYLANLIEFACGGLRQG